MFCPRCEQSLAAVDAGPYRGAPLMEAPLELVKERHASGVVIHRCSTCSGVFAENQALQRIEAVARDAGKHVSPRDAAARAYAAATPRIACPACGSETTRREWSFGTLVMVDICIECRGVWLDGGELEALQG